jgi:phospholipid/cholesterol/gamma-HCH transport system permease protein
MTTMAQAADFSLSESGAGRSAALVGDWTATELGRANQRLQSALAAESVAELDLSGIGRCDTTGAFEILKAANRAKARPKVVARPEVMRLLELVDAALRVKRTPARRAQPVHDLFERIGRGVIHVGVEGFDTWVFIGHLLVAVTRAIANPRRVRWAACFSLAERAGLDAIPIVSLTTFFIGAVVGLVGANMLTTFGAQALAVQLIGVAVLREFDILITAILLAGRSASAFAAEIGAMKMNQEVDAMQVLGIDPIDDLVFPRYFALFATIPLLTFAAALAGLGGGLFIAWTQLGLSPAFFFQQMVDVVGPTHFWVGMSKAPIMAIVIAGIGCHQGMEVSGDVESLGRRVTSAVVHAIFAAIMIDAIFALIYMKLDI